MTSVRVTVTAPSRLHFGMLSLAESDSRSFGGVGAMIDSPGLEVTVEPAERFAVDGPLSHRAAATARRLAAAWGTSGELPCRVTVVRAPREHIGLGTGTQLALAVAAGVNAFLGRPPASSSELAHYANRGERSAIGVHGFAHGGLLYDAGKATPDELAPLAVRLPLPPQWRFVLITPRDEAGLCGEEEKHAFATLPPVPPQRTAALRAEATERLLPAAERGDFAQFSESLYRFGYTAGLSFAAAQGGAFAGRRLTELVAWIRHAGTGGVGQSSWGPTLFAVAADDRAANNLAERFRGRDDYENLELTIASPNNGGARIEIAPI